MDADFIGASFSEIMQHIHNDLLYSDTIDDIAINGVQVEAGGHSVRSIGTGVTASLDVIERACRDGVDLLIVHHGLFLKGGVSALTGGLMKKIRLLIEHKVTLAGYHLPLDVHSSLGNAWALPLDLGWKNSTPCFPFKGSGFLGVRATLAQPVSAGDLALELKKYFHAEGSMCATVLSEKKVSSVAFIPGQGHKYIRQAAELGIDCFITGTFDEPVWHAAHEENIAFLAFGHHATERQGVQKLGKHLEARYGVRHTFYDEPNPF